MPVESDAPCRCETRPEKAPAAPAAGSRPFAPDKIFAHKDRVKQWLETGTSRPVIFELDMTNVCNQRCPHCFGYYPELDQARMSLDGAKSVLSQMRELGARAVTFTGGGDPLVNPGTLDAVLFARGLGLDVGFITNGQALNEAKVDVLLRSCVWVRVSIDAAGPEIYRLTHGMDEKVFAKVLDNVRLLTRRKRELGSETTVGIGYLTSDKTKGDIRGFAALGKELGVDYAQYRPILRRHGEPDVDYSDGTIIEAMLAARDEFSGVGYQVVCSEHKYREIAEGRLERSYKKCYGQHFASVVSADSKVYVCCHMRGVEKYAVGDLRTQSLAEIWSSEKRRQIAESVDFDDCPPLCRCDSFNNILWDLKEGRRALEDAPEAEWTHRNFI